MAFLFDSVHGLPVTNPASIMIISFSERKPYVFRDADGFIVLWRTVNSTGDGNAIHEVIRDTWDAAVRFARQIDSREMR